MWWFDICIYCQKIIPTKLISISHTYFFVLRTLKIYTPKKFQVYNTVLLTVVTMLGIRSLGLIHLWSLWRASLHATNPQPRQQLVSSRFLWVRLFFVLDFTCKWCYIAFVFLCLTYFTYTKWIVVLLTEKQCWKKGSLWVKGHEIRGKKTGVSMSGVSMSLSPKHLLSDWLAWSSGERCKLQLQSRRHVVGGKFWKSGWERTEAW